MRRFLLTFYTAFTLICLLWGQNEVYYYGANTKPVERIEDAVEYMDVIKRSNKKYTIRTHQKVTDKWAQVKKEKIRIQADGSQTIFYNVDTFFPKRFYRNMEEISPGEYLFKESDLTTLIRTGSSSSFLPLHLEGTVTEYHPNGKLKSRSEYLDNQLISNENWLSDGSKYIDSIFYSADEEPEYQMEDDFFKNYLLQNLAGSGLDFTQINDQVVLGWVVMETGDVEGVIALKGKSRQLNEFLVETIAQMPGAWKPATLNGAQVRYFMSIPLNFIPREANFQELDLSTGRLHYSKY